ncbi:hypothetical protein MYX06_01350 [Patescibacteria group bacterium AH-259-L05]|nr:hypothetical protein [Patescibacteria group bacterium AH-259-L05]
MRGNQKHKNYVVKWTPEFAYAIGLLTTDGCLSKDGRHLDFTSKDMQLVKTFKKCLNLDVKIGYKSDGHGRIYPRIQFSNVRLYKYLLTIGLTPNKSKTIGELRIPDKFFFDFLRGHFDGDGSCYSCWDKRWPNSFMFNIHFTSASLPHLKWLHNRVKQLTEVKGGGISKAVRSWQLGYAKRDSQILWKKMYYKKDVPCLLRKHKKVENILKVQAQVA